jgi:hypothetical protein
VRSINITTKNEEHIAFINDIFALHHIEHSAALFTITHIESLLSDHQSPGCNSLAHIAPMLTNSRLKNYKLAFFRPDIKDVLKDENPYVKDVGDEIGVYDLLGQINETLHEVTLHKHDFYDTFLLANSQQEHLMLKAHPLSLHYVGSTLIPVRGSHGYDLKIVTTIEPKTWDLRLQVEISPQ